MPESISDVAKLLHLIDELLAELQPRTRLRVGLDSVFDRDLGLDSLARVELLARVERRFDVRLPPEVLGNAETPGQLLDAIGAAGHRPAPDRPETERQAPVAASAGQPDSAQTLQDVLDWHVACHPERTHVSFYAEEDRIESLSYGELAEGGGRVAAALARAGVRPGQCVALMLPSGLEFFRCFVGILLAGAVPVPLYPPARPSQLEDHLRRQAGILRNCEARVLIGFDRILPLARMLTVLSPPLERVLTPAQLVATPMSRSPAGPDELALIQYTSGSTGDPKGVMLSHRNLLANIRAWGGAIGLASTDVAVSWLPLYHDMGLIGAWLGSLYHACPLVLMSPLDFLARPERWLWAIHHHRGTVSAAPNFAFDLCVRRLAEQVPAGLDLSSWRMVANGAEPVNAASMARFAEVFAPSGLRPEALTPVYGLAECTVGLAVPPIGRGVRVDRVRRDPMSSHARAEPASPWDETAVRCISCGPPLPGHEVRIVDEHGALLPERTIGRLEFRGPSATTGYYRNVDATSALFHDGWLVSGDFGYLADGEVHVTGRAKDMIIRGGRNFYPYDLEQAIGTLTGVRKGCVAVFGVGSAAGEGERLVVVAETNLRDQGARSQLEHHIVGTAAEQFGLPPDAVVLAPPHAVLKTSSGKIRRAAVRDAYLHGNLAAAARPPWLQFLRLRAAALGGVLRGAAGRGRQYAYGMRVWTAFAVLAPFATLAILTLPTLEGRWAAIHGLARLFRALSGCPLRVAGLAQLPAGPCVLVANHASYIDGFVLAATLPRPVRFVAKAEFRSHRLLHMLFARMGACFVERFDSRKGAEDAHSLAAGALDAPPLLFFAEGTFSARPGLQAFRLGAFQVAARNGLAVVPVALTGTREVLPDGSWRPRRGTLTVTIGPPVTADGSGWHEMLALRDAVRGFILAHCGEPDLSGR